MEEDTVASTELTFAQYLTREFQSVIRQRKEAAQRLEEARDLFNQTEGARTAIVAIARQCGVDLKEGAKLTDTASAEPKRVAEELHNSDESKA